jgi:hypothetical protein
MAAEERRAPRVVRDCTSMFAAAAGLRDQSDFAAGWLALWQAYGGTISYEPLAALGFKREHEPVSTMIGTVPVAALTDGERMGALNALAALLRLAGHPAMDSVFTLAGREG